MSDDEKDEIDLALEAEATPTRRPPMSQHLIQLNARLCLFEHLLGTLLMNQCINQSAPHEYFAGWRAKFLTSLRDYYSVRGNVELDEAFAIQQKELELAEKFLAFVEANLEDF